MGTKKICLFSKILSKWTLFYLKSSDLFNLYDFVHFQMSKNHSKSYNICYLYTCMHKYWLLDHLKKSSILIMAINSYKMAKFSVFLWWKMLIYSKFSYRTLYIFCSQSSQNYFLPLRTPLPNIKTQNWTKSQFFWDTLQIQIYGIVGLSW